ncbi:MAG TPA: hypothetical protein VMB21_00685 [Candidatus Limnocylindria bacterium]|nr:hypothetical protein [Candidatus Limnocylindria bacterium]
MEIDVTKTLAEITGIDWGPPPDGASSLIQERHSLRRLPIAQLSNPGIVRFLDMGCDHKFLIPIALARLKLDPEAVGLLCAVLRTVDFDWRSHPEWAVKLRELAGQVLNGVAQIDDDLERAATDAAIYRFWTHFEIELSSV